MGLVDRGREERARDRFGGNSGEGLRVEIATKRAFDFTACVDPGTRAFALGHPSDGVAKQTRLHGQRRAEPSSLAPQKPAPLPPLMVPLHSTAPAGESL